MADFKDDGTGPPKQESSGGRQDNSTISASPRSGDAVEDELLKKLKKLGKDVLDEPVPNRLIDAVRKKRASL